MREESNQQESVRIRSLLNRAAVSEYALGVSNRERAGKFKRVGKSFLERVEARVRVLVAGEVKSHPTKGITLK